MNRIACEEPWFSLLRNGTKQFTGRKNVPKYQALKSGDLVEFFCGEESFQAHIKEIKKFLSIEAYLQEVSLENALPGIKTIEEGLSVYSKWNTPEEIERWGFIAIYIVSYR